MLQYQYEDAVKVKLWKKILAVVLAAVLVIGALVELLCQAASIDNPNSSHWYKFDIQTAVNA